MKRYAAIMHENDSGCALSFPDLPGAFAAADDRDGLPAAVAEALDLWFEDRPDVAPAPLEEIRNRPDVRAQLAAGGALVAVAFSPAATGRARVQISIDPPAAARAVTRRSSLRPAAGPARAD